MALNEKDDRLWVYNGDQIPRWVAEHRKHLQHWSEDQKASTGPRRPSPNAGRTRYIDTITGWIPYATKSPP